MSIKAELNARLSTLAALTAKLPTLGLSEEETEILEELLSAKSTQEEETWLRERADAAVGYLFPTWRGGRIEKPKHPMWHDKSWWWNGASIESMAPCNNGDLEVELSSYVGCGETDTIPRFVLKREWLEAEDMAATIKAYCEAEFNRKETQKRAAELARAQADLAAAQARIYQMQGA